jgi:drug/metabolite transporter (DMT)-like permease
VHGGILAWKLLSVSRAVLCRTPFRQSATAGILDLGRAGSGYAIASAAGTILYIAIHKTSVADVAVIYATMPFFTAAIAWLWLGQRIDRLTLAASLLAVAGVAMTAGGASGSGPIGGQAVAALMTLMYASQAVIMRNCRPLAAGPVVCLASFVAAMASLPFAHLLSTPTNEIFILAISGIIYGALGDLLFAYGTQMVPSVQAALLTTLDVPLSALFVWLVAGELPARLTVTGGAVILVAVLGHRGLGRVLDKRSRRKDADQGGPEPLSGSAPALRNEDPHVSPTSTVSLWLATQSPASQHIVDCSKTALYEDGES